MLKHLFLLITIFFTFNTLAQDLSFIKVADGFKPIMKLRNDTPVVSFVKEDSNDGFIQFGVFNFNTATFNNKILANGNFYGPAYIDNYGSNSALILHNHDLNGGGAGVFTGNQNWTELDASDQGHDGWDASIKAISQNEIYVSYIDAIPFNGIGVQFSAYDGNAWEIDTVGSTALNYGFRTSLEIKSDNSPSILYYNDVTTDLEVAQKSDNTWNIHKVDTTGDVGYFCDTKMRNDSIFPAYIKRIGTTDAELKLSISSNNKDWETVSIGIINNFNFSLMGSKPLSIALSDSIHILSSSQNKILHHKISFNDFHIVESTVIKTTGTDSTFSQMANMDIDSKGKLHYCFGVITPINSEVIYATNANITDRPTIRQETFKVYPNPFTNHIKIDGKFETVKVYDLSGKLLAFNNDAIIDLSQLSVGCYNLMIDGVQTLIIKSK